jgi:hypothetical protein
MKQYRISSVDIVPESDNDCYLAPEDPIHTLKAISAMGGLGGQERLHAYNATLKQPMLGSNKGQIQREHNIRPGTESWFKLWFGKNNK